MSFADLDARVDATAKGLIALGVAPGDKVALWMVNRPEWIDAMFAVMKIGAVLVPVNTRFRTDDMAYVLGQSDAAAVILAERSGPVDYLAMMREVAPELGARPDPRFPALRRVVVLSDRPPAGTVGWREMVEAGAARRATPPSPSGPGRSIPRSAPSSSTPRAPPASPRARCTTHRVVRNASDHGDRMGISVNDAILMYLPLFHAFGFIEGPLMSMVRGARQVLTETFDRRRVPRPHREREGHDPPRLRHALSRSCSRPRRGARATCRACAPASAAPACRAPFRSRAGRARPSATS